MAQTGLQTQCWARESVSANEPNQSNGGVVAGCFRKYMYYSPVDTQATCAASGYFNGGTAYHGFYPDVVTGDQITIYSLTENTYITYQATVSSGVITLSPLNTGNGGSSFLSVNLTLAQLQTLYDTPVLLVPAPGAGNLILVDKFSLNVVYGSAAFTGGGVIAPQYGNTVHGGGTVATSATIAATELTSLSANTIVSLVGLLADTATSGIINKGIYLSNATADFASGTGASAIANIWYKTIAAS